jgi:hypothetical protein
MPRFRLSSAVLGMIGTIILHALLLPGVLWGSGAHADHAPVVPDLASLAFSSAATADITLLPPQTNNAAPRDLLAALSAQSIDLNRSLAEK